MTEIIEYVVRDEIGKMWWLVGTGSCLQARSSNQSRE